jgi:ribonuclease T2
MRLLPGGGGTNLSKAVLFFVGLGVAGYLIYSEQRQSASPEAVPPAASTAPGTQAPLPLGTGFDFYVLSLSWSPSYCEAEGADADRQQCDGGRPYAFIVHGLWPQFERGFPRDCATDESGVSNATMRGLYDIMPSAGLIRHHWRKHGACSGLGQQDYFEVLRRAREKVVIPAEFRRLTSYRTLNPDDVEAAFLKDNASLPRNGAAVVCDKRYLQEIRLCMSKDLDFRPCPEVDRRACRLPKVVMPPVRGG